MTTNDATAIAELAWHGYLIRRHGDKGWLLIDNFTGHPLQIAPHGGVAPTRRAAITEGYRRIAADQGTTPLTAALGRHIAELASGQAFGPVIYQHPSTFTCHPDALAALYHAAGRAGVDLRSMPPHATPNADGTITIGEHP